MEVRVSQTNLFLVLACSLVPGPLRAQNPPITLHTSAQEVVLDVAVRDSHGKFVKNLQPGEIEIYEDGLKQEVRSFRLVKGKAVIAEIPAAPDPAAPTKPQAPVANPLGAVNLVCIVFHNLDPFTKQYAVEAVQQFLKNDLPSDTWIAVFNLSSNITPILQFTRDRERVLQVANNANTATALDFMSVAESSLSAEPNTSTLEMVMSGNPATGGTVSVVQKVSGGEMVKTAILGADVSTGMGANARRGDIAGQRRTFGNIEGMRQTEQIINMIEQLGPLPGRKTILLLSPGLATTGDPERFQTILDKATRARVGIYAVDIHGLSQNSNVLAGNTALQHAASISQQQRLITGTSQQMAERMRQTDYMYDAVRTTDTRASLRALAEGTGGFLIADTNDLKKPLQHVVEDVDTHYEAVYRPQTELLDGRLRKIEVKVARPNLKAESRSGYFALPVLGGSADLQPYEVLGLATLSLPERPHAFDFRAAAFQFRPADSGSQQGTLVFELPASALAATPDAEKKVSRFKVAVVALVKDASGQVVEKYGEESPYEFPPDRLEAARNGSLTFAHTLNLPPGRYTADVAVIDREGRKASTSTLQFEQPVHRGVGLSSIVLVQRIDTLAQRSPAANPFEFPAKTQWRRVTPELNTTLKPDARPMAYFVVYPDPARAEKPKLQVEFLVGGKLQATQTSALPEPDASGAIALVVGAASHAGDCRLRITALQGTASATQVLDFTVQ